MPPIPISPSQPPEAFLGSRAPPAPTDALKEVEGLITRLRAELAGAPDKARKARLYYEIGEVEERSGDESAAARDNLAAFNADASFREPAEGLLRLLERRRSLRNLGKLVDALERGAETPEERVRAKTLRAYFLEDVGDDAEAAKQVAIEATELGAAPPETGMAWLTLELVAGRVGDASARLRALSARSSLARDPTWRALLQIDAARLQAAAGNVDTALEMLRSAREEGAGATFMAALAGERLSRRANGVADAENTAARAQAHAGALEAQGSLIEEAMTNPARGDALGVPRWARSTVTMVDAWVRAAEARSLAGDDDDAAALLDRARNALGHIEGDTANGPMGSSSARSSTPAFGSPNAPGILASPQRSPRSGSRASAPARTRTRRWRRRSRCAWRSTLRAKGTYHARWRHSQSLPRRIRRASLPARCNSISSPTTSLRRSPHSSRRSRIIFLRTTGEGAPPPPRCLGMGRLSERRARRTPGDLAGRERRSRGGRDGADRADARQPFRRRPLV